MSRLSLFKDENCFESCAAVNHPYLIFNPGMTLLSVSWMSLFSVASNFVFFHTSKLFFSRFHSLESREINAIYLRANAGTNSSHAHTHDARNVNFSNCVRNKRFGFVTITDAGFGFFGHCCIGKAVAFVVLSKPLPPELKRQMQRAFPISLYTLDSRSFYNYLSRIIFSCNNTQKADPLPSILL